jgi:hypothetical protein
MCLRCHVYGFFYRSKTEIPGRDPNLAGTIEVPIPRDTYNGQSIVSYQPAVKRPLPGGVHGGHPKKVSWPPCVCPDRQMSVAQQCASRPDRSHV